jgi:hypothetical protein
MAIKFKDIVAYKFGRIKLPMIQYPDCQACECVSETTEAGSEDAADTAPSPGFLSQLSNPNLYIENVTTYIATQPFEYGTNNVGVNLNYPANGIVGENEDAEDYNAVIAVSQTAALAGNNSRSTNPQIFKINRSTVISEPNAMKIFSVGLTLPPGERINIYNTRKKYFDGDNKIKVSFNNPANISTHHYDNTLTILSPFDVSPGDLLTFISPTTSRDINFQWSGETSVGGNVVRGIVGKTNLHGGSINVNYATTQTGPATTVMYNLPSINANCVNSVTVNVISAGTISYTNCYSVYVEYTANTLNSHTITNTSGVTLSSLGGTAVYNITASGDSVQRHIYPSDVE